MFSGIIRHLPAAVAALMLSAAAVLPGHTAAADPSQDQKFFDLLGQKDIPPVDNANSLVTSAKRACLKLDDGMPVGDLVELIRNNGFNDNPLTRLQPQDRITRTIDQFINASVEAYCPYNKGKIASIAAYRAGRPEDPGYQVTTYTRSAAATRGVVLASLVGTVPVGEIAPTKPLPVPAQPPPPVPQEVQPAPQQPPPPPRHVQQVPQQAPPPPEEPPPPAEAPVEPPPEAAPPAAPAAPGGGAGGGNAPAAPGGGAGGGSGPGGGAGGGNAPASPTPDQPSPPGHIRLAP